MAQVDCPGGKKALGGGGSATTMGVTLVESAPTDTGTGRSLVYHNDVSYPATVYAWVICANISS